MNAKLRNHLHWIMVNSGIVAIIFLAWSCSSPREKNNPKVGANEGLKPLIIKKPPSSFGDTVIVDRESAVFYNPDSLQMAKIKSVNEERIYTTITHDCFYQMQNARDIIRLYWPRIRIVEVVNARYLLFLKKDKRKTVIDLDVKNDICGLYLFDPKKEPELVDMPNVDTFLGFYFGQK